MSCLRFGTKAPSRHNFKPPAAMELMTMIARVIDGLLLAATMDEEGVCARCDEFISGFSTTESENNYSLLPAPPEPRPGGTPSCMTCPAECRAERVQGAGQEGVQAAQRHVAVARDAGDALLAHLPVRSRLHLVSNICDFELRMPITTLTAGSYIIEGGVCYLALASHSYPRDTAFAYLSDVHKEFMVGRCGARHALTPL